jgi:hypothetical protein
MLQIRIKKSVAGLEPTLEDNKPGTEKEEGKGKDNTSNAKLSPTTILPPAEASLKSCTW